MTLEERRLQLRRAQLQRRQANGQNVVMRTDDGGRVIRGRDGALSFTSPAYSTNDPDKVREIMEGSSGAEQSTLGFQEQIVQERPIASRAASYAQGVPFLGSRLDEAVGGMFGAEAGERVTSAQEAMQATRPGEALAGQLATGVASAVPMAMAAIPSLPAQGASLATRMIGGALGGAVAGGVEGAVYGSGEQEGGRLNNATRQGLTGAMIGGALGGAGPALVDGVGNLIQRARSTPEKAAGAALGVSPDAARMLGQIEQMEPGADAALARAGQNAMIADIGPTASGVLDTSLQVPSSASREGRVRVDDRAGDSLGRINQTLDDVLGKPEGLQTAQADIRTGTAGARRDDYAAAYSTRIDYATAAGEDLEALTSRIPPDVYKTANRLIQLQGSAGAPMVMEVSEDGVEALTSMPTVQQWDYIKRALQQSAESTEGTGALGRKTTIGAAYSTLARDVRNAVADAVPAYASALETAADAITRQQAIREGSTLLSRGTTRDEARGIVDGMTGPELVALKQGIRSQIDDTLANVAAVASDPNIDARAARTALNMLTSPASKEKLELVLGARDAGRVNRTIQEASVALGMRADIATNSRTAGREFTREFMQDVLEPGALTKLGQASPVQASQAIVQAMTKTAPRDMAAREVAIFAEITDVLTRSGLPEAQRALSILRAMQAEQPVSEAAAQFVAQAFTATIGAVGYSGGQNVLSNRTQSGNNALQAPTASGPNVLRQ